MDEEDMQSDYDDVGVYYFVMSSSHENDHCFCFAAFHESEYCDEMLVLGCYLSSLQKSDNCSNKQFMKIRKRVKSFFLHEGHLWKHPKKEIGHPQRVVCMPEVKKQIIQECHEELWVGQSGIWATFVKVKERY
jgi:hypothetical protein